MYTNPEYSTGLSELQLTVPLTTKLSACRWYSLMPKPRLEGAGHKTSQMTVDMNDPEDNKKEQQ